LTFLLFDLDPMTLMYLT